MNEDSFFYAEEYQDIGLYRFFQIGTCLSLPVLGCDTLFSHGLLRWVKAYKAKRAEIINRSQPSIRIPPPIGVIMPKAPIDA